MTIGKKIKELRKQKKLTQKRLSKLTGIAEITIRQYEADKYNPKMENLQKIANALSVSIVELIPESSPLQKEQLERVDHLAQFLEVLNNPLVTSEFSNEQIISLRNKLSEEINLRYETLDVSTSLKDVSDISSKFPSPSPDFYKQDLAYQQGYVTGFLSLGISPDLIASRYQVPFTNEHIDLLVKNEVIAKKEANTLREYKKIIDSEYADELATHH
ncbi:hypothetical protein HMPREF1093_03584 [Hungatella hathewayi 12489931]|uniref:helix-turn-helix domain-containing protein n=1 Tax=Hungatella hathewayi TaxID=154046 RepID=UPI0002D15D27|nr:helix-turn-helix domain-containing protein [Hungatella hathewayi]ENY93508.1 hypothetical protein HMPREF1093_03584 [Hungatella hathewayi 12489931]